MSAVPRARTTVLRSSLLRAFTASGVVAHLLVASPGAADACSCAEAPPPAAALAHADAVFVATIGSVQRKDHGKLVQLTVTRTFKGATEGALTIRTGHGGGDCGIGFTTGSSWLIYAERSSSSLYSVAGFDGLATIPCGRTTPLDAAGDDIAALTAPRSEVIPAASSDVLPSTAAPLTAAPPPGSKGCACDAAGSASRGSRPSGWIAVALALAVLAIASRSLARARAHAHADARIEGA